MVVLMESHHVLKVSVMKVCFHACLVPLRQLAGKEWLWLEIDVHDLLPKHLVLLNWELELLWHFDGRVQVMERNML